MNSLNLRERQKIALDVLEEFSTYCKNNNLHYTLEFGTLLGAIRHGGFIPWDDDIDICMPREDYDKLFNKEKIGPYLKIDNFTCGDNHDTNFLKVYDTTTYSIKKNSQQIRCGIYIDIYPMDYLPKSAIKKIIQKLFLYRYYLATKLAEKPTRIADNKLLQVVYNMLSPFYQRKGRSYYAKKLNEIARWGEKDSSEMSVLIEPDRIKKRLIKTCEYFDTMLYAFETKEFYGVRNYNKRLTLEYGDYRKLPPENERIGHISYNFYKR